MVGVVDVRRVQRKLRAAGLTYKVLSFEKAKM